MLPKNLDLLRSSSTPKICRSKTFSLALNFQLLSRRCPKLPQLIIAAPFLTIIRRRLSHVRSAFKLIQWQPPCIPSCTTSHTHPERFPMHSHAVVMERHPPQKETANQANLTSKIRKCSHWCGELISCYTICYYFIFVFVLNIVITNPFIRVQLYDGSIL